MPEDGVTLSPSENLLSNKEILKITELFVSEGVDKVRLTGGEPLVRRDIVSLVGEKLYIMFSRKVCLICI